MIIKRMDSKQDEMEALSSLLEEPINANQKFLIERELKAMKKGVHGEEDSAYYINFYYGDSKNWAIIHDLRIEHENQVAQIDHLLINRFFEIYVLESKNYSYGIKITPEGEFQAYYGKQTFGIPSPVEQNKRHIHLLDRFLKDNNLLPKRLGISIRPKYLNFILISPKSLITRPAANKFDTSTIIKADTLKTKIDNDINKFTPLSDLSAVGKISSAATIEEMSTRLVSFHRPLSIDYRAKFGLPAKSYSITQKNPAIVNDERNAFGTPKFFCCKCKKSISEKAAKFCWQNKTKFGGRAYCFDCQKEF